MKIKTTEISSGGDNGESLHQRNFPLYSALDCIYILSNLVSYRPLSCNITSGAHLHAIEDQTTKFL